MTKKHDSVIIDDPSYRLENKQRQTDDGVEVHRLKHEGRVQFLPRSYDRFWLHKIQDGGLPQDARGLELFFFQMWHYVAETKGLRKLPNQQKCISNILIGGTTMQ
jgi:hypothetical protein